MNRLIVILSILVLCFSGIIVCAQDLNEINKTFAAKERIRIETASGDCNIRTGDASEIKVNVVFNVDPEDSFEPDIQEKSNEIKIKERWHGRSKGRVTWTITVPKNTEVRVSTASGDLSIDGISAEVEAESASGDVILSQIAGNIEVSTASGDVEVNGAKGELEISTASGDVKATDVNGESEMNTASGDIRIKQGKGAFDLNCASGDIQISGIVLEEESDISTASGDIDVVLAESAAYNLECSAASGDIELDYNGNEIKGYFEFSSRKHGGSIRSSVDFEKEEEFDHGGRNYVKKSFSQGGTSPQILLSTSSGNIVFKK